MREKSGEQWQQRIGVVHGGTHLLVPILIEDIIDQGTT